MVLKKIYIHFLKHNQNNKTKYTCNKKIYTQCLQQSRKTSVIEIHKKKEATNSTDRMPSTSFCGNGIGPLDIYNLNKI